MTRFALAPIAAACALFAASAVHAESTGDAAASRTDTPAVLGGALQGGLGGQDAARGDDGSSRGGLAQPVQKLTDDLAGQRAQERGDEAERDEAGNLLGRRLAPGAQGSTSMDDDEDSTESSGVEQGPLAGLEGTEDSGDEASDDTSRSLNVDTSLSGRADDSGASGSGSASVRAGEAGGSGSGDLSVGSGSSDGSESGSRPGIDANASLRVDPPNTSEDAARDDGSGSELEQAGDEAESEFEEGAENIEDEF